MAPVPCHRAMARWCGLRRQASDTERTVNAQQPRKGKKGKGKRKATDGACSMPQSDGEVVRAKAPGFRHR